MTKTKARPQMLQDLIPDPQIAKDYIHRELHGHEDFEMLDWARMEGINILLEGPTGPGKTMLARAYCSARQIPCGIMTAQSAGEPGQMIGKHLLLNGEMVWVDGLVTTLVRHGEALILFDEINFYPPGITATVHPLLDAQRQIILYDHVQEFEDQASGMKIGLPEVVKAASGLLIMGAFNEGYRGTDDLNEAFRNRFDIAVDWGYSEAVEEELVASTTLRNIAREIRKMSTTGEIDTPCSTNRLQFFERTVDDIGLDSAVSNFISQFAKNERDAIRNVFNLNRDRLWNDYEKANNRDPNKGFFVSEDA